MRQPKLLLKPSAYKTDKLYSILPDDGSGDFANGALGYVGNGTRVNKYGLIETVPTDTPRIDYLNGCGLLLEPTRTNLMTYTAAATGWSTTGQLTANDTIAPDGTKTATRHEDDSAASAEATTKSTTISASTQYTFSIFIKFGNNDRINLDLATTAGTTASSTHFLDSNGTWTVNTDTSTIINNSGSTYYGDGWYRFYATFTSLTGNTGLNITMYPSYGNFDVEPQGYYWFWGNQLEVGGFVTSLIPTVASSVERVNDIWDKGSFTDLSLSNGFIVVKLQDLIYDTSFGTPIFQIGDTNGECSIYAESSTPTVFVENTDATSDTYTLTDTSHNVGFNISWNNVDVWVDGVKVLSTAAEFYFTSKTIAMKGTGTKSKIKEVAIYDKTVTDIEAKALTQ